MRPGRALVTIAATVGMLLATQGSAVAQESKPNGICTGTGTLKAENGVPKATWEVKGRGTCISSPNGMTVDLLGFGTSNSLGLCTPGGLLVSNLRLDVFVRWEDVVTGAIKNEVQVWSSPVSIFPILTPFLITRPDAPGGDFPQLLGVSLHHLTGTCGNEGRAPQASFVWVST